MRIVKIVVGAALISVVAGGALAEGDWRAEKAAYESYKTQKATCESAADWVALADTEHAKRLGWVRAWCLQRAAMFALRFDALDDAGRYAHAVLDTIGAQDETKAKAWTVIGHVRATKSEWQRASDAYRAARELDPNLESAKAGEKNLRDAGKWRDPAGI